MKALVRALLLLSVAVLPMSVPAQQYFSYTGVRRVVKFRILPGKAADFYKYVAAATKTLEAEKAAGLITGYSMAHTVDYIGEDKYDVSFVITYKDMATFDTLADKAEPIIAKAYGTPESRAAMNKLANESAEVVSSELVREIVIKP
jgi:hypothetical protein